MRTSMALTWATTVSSLSGDHSAMRGRQPERPKVPHSRMSLFQALLLPVGVVLQEAS